MLHEVTINEVPIGLNYITILCHFYEETELAGVFLLLSPFYIISPTMFSTVWSWLGLSLLCFIDLKDRKIKQKS